MMDVEKLIEAAEWCLRGATALSRLDFCQKCKFADECDNIWDVANNEIVYAISDHYEQKLSLLREDIKLQQMLLGQHKEIISHYKALLASERSKVIAEVRSFLNESYRIPCPDDGAEWFVKKLDSMEADKC